MHSTKEQLHVREEAGVLPTLHLHHEGRGGGTRGVFTCHDAGFSTATLLHPPLSDMHRWERCSHDVCSLVDMPGMALL